MPLSVTVAPVPPAAGLIVPEMADRTAPTGLKVAISAIQEALVCVNVAATLPGAL